MEYAWLFSKRCPLLLKFSRELKEKPSPCHPYLIPLHQFPILYLPSTIHHLRFSIHYPPKVWQPYVNLWQPFRGCIPCVYKGFDNLTTFLRKNALYLSKIRWIHPSICRGSLDLVAYSNVVSLKKACGQKGVGCLRFCLFLRPPGRFYIKILV